MRSRSQTCRAAFSGKIPPVLIVFVAALLFLWGVNSGLPLIPHIDEPLFVRPAVGMAASGSLNPSWFSHPASTLLYPMMALFRLLNLLEAGGPLLGPAPRVAEEFARAPAGFYLTGRILSVLYALLAVWLVYLVGKEAFGWRAGLLGAWFSVLCPLTVRFSRLVRSDSATAFFSLLVLYACLKVYHRPGGRAQLLAGASLGLALATKYSLLPLVGIYILANVFLLAKEKRPPALALGRVAGGLAAAALVFILTTPFFLIELNTALANIRFEMRSSHPGADGLSPLGNLLWYLGTAIPRALHWPRPALAAVAAVWVLAERKPLRLLVLALPVVLLVGLSSSALHWERWLIPILPVISLLAAGLIVKLLDWAVATVKPGKLTRVAGVTAVILAVSYAPARDVVGMNIRLALPDTRILAREWAAAYLPPGAVIAQEWYTAPLDGLPFTTVKVRDLPARSFEYYRSVEVEYFMAGRTMYRRYFADPERFESHVAFYRRLFEEGRLLREFSPSRGASGPTVRIYEMRP